MNLLDPKPRIAPDVTRRLKSWARERWGDNIEVTVAELRCTEPGCPPLETVLVISPPGSPTFQHKVHRAAADVTRTDLDDQGPTHDHH